MTETLIVPIIKLGLMYALKRDGGLDWLIKKRSFWCSFSLSWMY